MKTKQSKVINKLRTKNAWSCLHYYDTGERISRWRINVIDSEHNNKQPTDRLHGVNAGNILANGCVSHKHWRFNWSRGKESGSGERRGSRNATRFGRMRKMEKKENIQTEVFRQEGDSAGMREWDPDTAMDKATQ